MVHQNLYCAEQIIVPQKFPNILKTYAKAVIRTQPYDLLRWSAAYFRCIAANVPPPVKVRLEKESRFGNLTKGYLRVLVEQKMFPFKICRWRSEKFLSKLLGKGFFVQREILQIRWASLSLPEEELLKFLSLCRMLHWSQINFLEIFAVMVASLNDSVHSSVQMLCELLTDCPEGGSNGVPFWMFNVCYSFIAKLDCSEQQTFQNGRKVYGDNSIEDLNVEPEAPKVYSLDLFRYAMIERFIQKEQQRIQNIREKDTISEYSSHKISNYSDVSTSFNFVGLNDPESVIRRTKDFESVIALLNEGQQEALRNFNNQDTRNKVIQYLLIEKKATKHADSEKDNFSVDSFAENLPLTVRSDISSSFKFIGNMKNPYEVINMTPHIDTVLVTLSKKQRKTLRNFTERHTADKRVKEELFRDISKVGNFSEYSEEKVEMETFDNQTVLVNGLEPPWSWIYQFASMNNDERSYNFVECDTEPSNETPSLSTGRSFDFRRGLAEDNLSDLDQEEQKQDLDAFIAKIIERLGQAISVGECDIKNLKSMCHIIESDDNLKEMEQNLKIIIDKLNSAHENDFSFESLAELDEFLRNEYVNEQFNSSPVVDVLTKTFADCDIKPNESSNAEEAAKYEIMGLVDSISEEPESTKKIDRQGSPANEREENLQTNNDFNDVTDDYDIVENISARPFTDTKNKYISPPSFDCVIPKLPGIGKECSQQVMDKFLAFISSRASEEDGMVYTKFFSEPKCPAMTDNFN